MSNSQVNNSEEENCFTNQLIRGPIESYTERSRLNLKNASKSLYPNPKELNELQDCDADEDTHSVNGVEDYDVEDQPILNSADINVKYKVNLEVEYNISKRSPSQERDFPTSSPKDKILNPQVRKRARHEEVSRQSPSQEKDLTVLNALEKKLSNRRREKYEPSKHCPSLVKTSTVPESKFPNNFSIISIICIVLLLGLIFWFSPLRLYNLLGPGKGGNVIWNYQLIVSKTKHSFGNQPKSSFKVVASALKAVNGSNPAAPAVILLLASKGAESHARRLGEELVGMVAPNPIRIEGASYRELDSDTGKKHIDDALRSMEESSVEEYHAVLVEELHRIPGETALMFHTYCDNENAPVKHVVYVLIVHMEEDIHSDSMKEWDIAVYKRLNKAWGDIDEDQRTPLLSRLTVSVAAIKNE